MVSLKVFYYIVILFSSSHLERCALQIQHSKDGSFE